MSGTIYYLAAETRSYEGDYFLEEYAAQYGRTYIEDEEHLRMLARRRLALPGVLPESGAASARLLEVGCAAGFFLDEARKLGFVPEGLEISEYAAQYGRDTLGLEIQARAFLDVELEPAAYDVVAAFYVVEHFARQRTVFEKIAAALRPGGRFVFALPSCYGPLFEYSPEQWQSTHPTDHHADYSPRALRVVLQQYGLELHAVRPASYHQQRAKACKAWWPNWLYRRFADWRAYGDTLEGVAIRRA